MQLAVHIEKWPTTMPFRITGMCWNAYEVVVVEITDGRHVGRGEGSPVFYLNETADSVYGQIEAVAKRVEGGIEREALLELMPAGAARNAIDCALWDYEAKRTGQTIWRLTGIEPKSRSTAFTIGIEDTPEAMAVRARQALGYPVLKIKVGDDRPIERVAAIRAVRPDACLTVDANQGWTFERLVEVAPRLARLGVKLIEQPLPRGRDEMLEGYKSSVPLCADEACQHRGELEQASRRYQIINIKLDKAGGLTEALLLAKAVREKGLKVLAGCMGATSLGMAPGYVLAQLCDYVELDGHLLLKHDRFPTMTCDRGNIAAPDLRLWG